MTFFGCDKACYLHFSVHLMCVYIYIIKQTLEVFKSKGKNKLHLKY